MKLPKIEGLDDKNQLRFELCATDVIDIMDFHFPELRNLYDNFEVRVFMTLYLEMIHMGFFK
jgi:hypothetical protein